MPIRLSFADRAAVQNDIMADGAVGADHERKAHVGVEDAVVLNIGARADGDPFIVAAQHAAEPDIGVFLQLDAADELRARRHEDSGRRRAGAARFRRACKAALASFSLAFGFPRDIAISSAAPQRAAPAQP